MAVKSGRQFCSFQTIQHKGEICSLSPNKRKGNSTRARSPFKGCITKTPYIDDHTHTQSHRACIRNFTLREDMIQVIKAGRNQRDTMGARSGSNSLDVPTSRPSSNTLSHKSAPALGLHPLLRATKLQSRRHSSAVSWKLNWEADQQIGILYLAHVSEAQKNRNLQRIVGKEKPQVQHQV